MVGKTYSFEKDGETYSVYTLKNKNGCEADVLTYGARIIRISVPDRNGNFSNCAVGFATPEEFLQPNPCFGATCGRYANRIGGAKIVLNGKTYALEANENGNILHGGNTGRLDTVNWNAEIDGDALVLRYLSKDGAGGFPGNLSIALTLTLSDANELTLDYTATTDKDTVCNLTNHTYFNIGDDETVLDQELMIKARKMTAVDKELIPTGEYTDIDATPYSFLPAKKLGKDMFSDAEFIKHCNGFDFNYCIEREGEGLELCATVYDKKSGRKMECYTTLPGIQLYTACGTGGVKGFVNHCALCLETQGYPNSPNIPHFPSTVLKAGETYRETTSYRFLTE